MLKQKIETLYIFGDNLSPTLKLEHNFKQNHINLFCTRYKPLNSKQTKKPPNYIAK